MRRLQSRLTPSLRRRWRGEIKAGRKHDEGAPRQMARWASDACRATPRTMLSELEAVFVGHKADGRTGVLSGRRLTGRRAGSRCVRQLASYDNGSRSCSPKVVQRALYRPNARRSACNSRPPKVNGCRAGNVLGLLSRFRLSKSAFNDRLHIRPLARGRLRKPTLRPLPAATSFWTRWTWRRLEEATGSTASLATSLFDSHMTLPSVLQQASRGRRPQRGTPSTKSRGSRNL